MGTKRPRTDDDGQQQQFKDRRKGPEALASHMNMYEQGHAVRLLSNVWPRVPCVLCALYFVASPPVPAEQSTAEPARGVGSVPAGAAAVRGGKRGKADWQKLAVAPRCCMPRSTIPCAHHGVAGPLPTPTPFPHSPLASGSTRMY